MSEILLVALGAGGVLAALGIIYTFVLTDEQRSYLHANMRSLTTSRTPPAQSEQALSGNVPVKADEWNVRADASGGYSFPDANDPITRYEDLNRRLIIFKAADKLLPSGIPARNVADHPQTLECIETDMLEAVDRQLVKSHPVIFDPSGLFAKASHKLDFVPFMSDPMINAYLAIPLQERPVVISYDPPLPDAKSLTFRRWGFEGQKVLLSYFLQYPEDCFTYILQRFIGARGEWLWFSTARLRHDIVMAHWPREAKLAEIKKEMLENRFAKLWGLRDEASAADTLDQQPSDGEEAVA